MAGSKQAEFAAGPRLPGQENGPTSGVDVGDHGDGLWPRRAHLPGQRKHSYS